MNLFLRGYPDFIENFRSDVLMLCMMYVNFLPGSYFLKNSISEICFGRNRLNF